MIHVHVSSHRAQGIVISMDGSVDPCCELVLTSRTGADLPDHRRKASADRPVFPVRRPDSDKSNITCTIEPLRSRASTGTFCVRFEGGIPLPEPGPNAALS